MIQNETICTGKFKIMKYGAIIFKKEIDYICHSCMCELAQFYIDNYLKGGTKK